MLGFACNGSAVFFSDGRKRISISLADLMRSLQHAANSVAEP